MFDRSLILGLKGCLDFDMKLSVVYSIILSIIYGKGRYAAERQFNMKFYMKHLQVILYFLEDQRHNMLQYSRKYSITCKFLCKISY